MTDHEREELRRLLHLYKDDLPPSFSPVNKPVDRFAHLNPEVRQLFGELSAEDARTMRDALRFYRSAHTVSRFMRWLLLTCLLALGAGAAFGDHVANLWKFLFGTK